MQCNICFDKAVNTAFLPCGHLPFGILFAYVSFTRLQGLHNASKLCEGLDGNDIITQKLRFKCTKYYRH